MNAILQFGTIIPFLKDIKQLEDNPIFFSPISDGKWSSAAIVAHLLFWDQYIQNTRLPMMQTYDILPSGQVDVQSMNNVAQTYAHSGKSKLELIDTFINNRKNLLDDLAKVDLKKSFSIGEQTLTVEQYIINMAVHDQHHMKQIEEAYHKKRIE